MTTGERLITEQSVLDRRLADYKNLSPYTIKESLERALDLASDFRKLCEAARPSPSVSEEAVALCTALQFYADMSRYCGANLRLDGPPDQYQPANLPYRYDVTRDGGRIARDALSALPAPHRDVREECARIVENFCDSNPFPTIQAAIAAAIRAGK